MPAEEEEAEAEVEAFREFLDQVTPEDFEGGKQPMINPQVKIEVLIGIRLACRSRGSRSGALGCGGTAGMVRSTVEELAHE